MTYNVLNFKYYIYLQYLINFEFSMLIFRQCGFSHCFVPESCKHFLPGQRLELLWPANIDHLPFANLFAFQENIFIFNARPTLPVSHIEN